MIESYRNLIISIFKWLSHLCQFSNSVPIIWPASISNDTVFVCKHKTLVYNKHTSCSLTKKLKREFGIQLGFLGELQPFVIDYTCPYL